MVSRENTLSPQEYKLPSHLGLAGEAHRIPAAATVAMREANTPYAQLMILADQFKVAAMAIDPTIKEVWVTTIGDVDDGTTVFSGLHVRRSVTR